MWPDSFTSHALAGWLRSPAPSSIVVTGLPLRRQGPHGLELLSREDRRLLERQQRLFGDEVPLWERYEQACDFLEDDLASGYVRVLQEMLAAGWSEPAVAAEVLRLLSGWFDALEGVCVEAERRFGPLGPLTPRRLGTLVGLAFLGGEQLALLGDADWRADVLDALRSLGEAIRAVEDTHA
jgi:hypothetical protein